MLLPCVASVVISRPFCARWVSVTLTVSSHVSWRSAPTHDEVHGFNFFDDRDLIGFVDGTENPVEQAAIDATIIGEEDAAFAGGSYVIVQKYLHDLNRWNALQIEEQQKIIGRTKLSDIELDDTVKPTCAHNVLTTIIEDGNNWRSCATTCRSVTQARRSSEPISSAMRDPRAGSNRCS